MIWLPILLLAIIAFAIAAFVLRLPRRGWTMLGAVLMFGLAGYAMQGHPGQAGAPKQAAQDVAQSGEVIVAVRRALFDPTQPPPRYLMVSDGFARRGRFDEAAGLLRGGLRDNPNDTEGWLALANALVEHAQGQVTPAAQLAFERAEATMPAHPGPAYFLGIAYLRSGKPKEARDVWAQLLEKTPADAPWRADLKARIDQLDAALASIATPAP